MDDGESRDTVLSSHYQIATEEHSSLLPECLRPSLDEEQGPERRLSEIERELEHK